MSVCWSGATRPRISTRCGSTSPDVIEALLNKPAMEQLLQRVGVMVPASARISSAADLIGFGDRHWFAVATLAGIPWTDPAVFLSSTRFLLSRLVRRA
jgi:hypothetical protein